MTLITREQLESQYEEFKPWFDSQFSTVKDHMIYVALQEASFRAWIAARGYSSLKVEVTQTVLEGNV